jgi:hypothetical protein
MREDEVVKKKCAVIEGGQTVGVRFTVLGQNDA